MRRNPSFCSHFDNKYTQVVFTEASIHCCSENQLFWKISSVS